MLDFTLEGEFIHMIQLLKAAHIAQSGGEAQMLVSEGAVKYNGEIDFRKRLKVKSGDTVECRGQVIKVK
ncbi:RNA-binding S4 domain-containing protein [Daejeonella sp.]|jgi:ribosome-associated protein|uniref:RNA-binding S4 domain-containing protein n=1 Tax=Daejeonella sp. TaxID=2805397 RepID=UPI003782DC0D